MQWEPWGSRSKINVCGPRRELTAAAGTRSRSREDQAEGWSLLFGLNGQGRMAGSLLFGLVPSFQAEGWSLPCLPWPTGEEEDADARGGGHGEDGGGSPRRRAAGRYPQVTPEAVDLADLADRADRTPDGPQRRTAGGGVTGRGQQWPAFVQGWWRPVVYGSGGGCGVALSSKCWYRREAAAAHADSTGTRELGEATDEGTELVGGPGGEGGAWAVDDLLDLGVDLGGEEGDVPATDVADDSGLRG